MSSDSFSFLINQVNNDIDNCVVYVKGLLALVGAWYTIKLSVRLSYSIACYVKDLPLLLRKTNFVKSYGSWVIVTGCTNGIGSAFATEFASKGLNVVLISRNEKELERKAEVIEKLYGVHTIAIVHDFNQSSAESIDHIKQRVENLDIGILVNNVGIHYEYPMEFQTVDESRIDSMVQINIASVVNLTRAVLPGMIKRRRGLVVNMSSSAGSMPFALISLYSATKAFLNHFSQSLHDEMTQYNVHVQSLLPYYIGTRMVEYSALLQKSSLLTPAPTTYVRHAVRTLGRYKVNTGYFPHTVQAWVQSICPEFLSLFVGNWLQRRLRDEGKLETKKED